MANFWQWKLERGPLTRVWRRWREVYLVRSKDCARERVQEDWDSRPLVVPSNRCCFCLPQGKWPCVILECWEYHHHVLAWSPTKTHWPEPGHRGRVRKHRRHRERKSDRNYRHARGPWRILFGGRPALDSRYWKYIFGGEQRDNLLSSAINMWC